MLRQSAECVVLDERKTHHVPCTLAHPRTRLYETALHTRRQRSGVSRKITQPLNGFTDVLYYSSSPAGVRSIAMNVSVCLYVCPLARLRDHMSKLYEIFFTLPVTVDRSFSDDNAICYAPLPVLWMSSSLPIMGQMARG